MEYQKILNENIDWINEIWTKLDKKLDKISIRSREKLPYTTINGTHDNNAVDGQYTCWTNGFWGGLMWLMYKGTGKETYKTTAQRSEQLLDNAFERLEWLNHDVGFMWHLTSGLSYRLTGDTKSKNRNLLAAMLLASRYEVDGNYIRCWNGKWEGEDTEGWTIIDCMMNLPLLYWASEEIEDKRFARIANRHADMAMRDHVRNDGSVNHIVMHNPTTPDEVLGTKGGQGYAEGSSWSRGCAWAVYGFILAYIHTKNEKYLETAKKAADYFIECVEKTNYLPLLDFRQPKTPVYYDATAGAIVACGLIEIAKNVEENEQTRYLTSALEILKALEKNWCNWDENEDSILQMGSLRYGDGLHMPIIYGDYFFVEAILKLKKTNFLVW